MSRKPRVGNYPAILTRETLDDAHRDVLNWIERFHRDRRMAPTMREVGRGLGHTPEWTRLACDRLVKAGLLVNPKGFTRAMRLADAEEYQAGVASRWAEWLAELHPAERSALVEAVHTLEGERIGKALDNESTPSLPPPPLGQPESRAS